jgi:hypothetical protein
MENQGTVKVIEGNILEQIRQRPAMFIGGHSLTKLRAFLDGYFTAKRELRIEIASPLPNDFHEWVAYRLHFLESTLGYANMILKRTPDEAQALKRFFELFDEAQSRQAKVIAKVRHHPENAKVPQQTKFPDGKISDWEEIPVAEEVSLVIFTDDPGFFVINDDSSSKYPRKSDFCPSLSWLRWPYRPDPEFVTILDQEQFNRLLCEAVIFEQARREESENLQRELKEQENKIN